MNKANNRRVVISCGPIPARLDSVKFITNRFQGGLAFETAHRLHDDGFRVTIVKWVHTRLPEGMPITDVVNVADVVEYYNWFKENANSYDGFIMAAAVANLMPSNPYAGKFPSHSYQVGDKFNIEFEIAPRAIDIIKQVNPRACLIGYKLFDAKTDEELIEIAQHTLKDSKANVIFANTPSEAKVRKIAVLQDGSHMEFTFEGHLYFIERVLRLEYFSTVIKPIPEELREDSSRYSIENCKNLVRLFEKTFLKYGTVAFKTSDGGVVTTSRGHQGEPVYIHSINYETRKVYAEGKATLNIPTLCKFLEQAEPGDYLVHRHYDDPKSIHHTEDGNYSDLAYGYAFPGTTEEINLAKCYLEFMPSTKEFSVEVINLLIDCHGYIKGYKRRDVDWSKYYAQFPSKYFNIPSEMSKILHEWKHGTTIEVGCNTDCICEYYIDDNIENVKAKRLRWEDIGSTSNIRFGLILLRNSINYLSIPELTILKESLSPRGHILANGFIKAPKVKLTDTELSVDMGDGSIIHHLVCDDQIYEHTFYNRGKTEYEQLGFICEEVSQTGMLIAYTNRE